MISPVTITPNPTAAGANAVAVVAGEGAKLAGIATPFFMVWWNRADYSDPDYDPTAEVVQVNAVVVDALNVDYLKFRVHDCRSFRGRLVGICCS